MRKILSLIIAVLLTIGLCTISAFASEDTLTKDEAILLVQDAYRMMRLGQHGILHNDLTIITSIYDIFYHGEEVIFIDTSASGEKYYEPERYRKAIPFSGSDLYEEFNSLNKIRNKISAVFTESMTDRMLKVKEDNPNCTELFYIDSYREDENSELLISQEVGEPMQYPYLLYAYNHFEASKNTAKMIITLKRKTHVVVEPTTYPKETVEFTKTADGWRVSGGTAFEVMLGDREPNPNTGDPSAIAIPALAVSALVSLAVPVGIMRRRRRYA